ncbi:MAG TPA: hypothetical protein PLR45_14415 [Flavobacteriales bacterium]|nr:hypothetical protein [Flavobacteriales bacterium]
MEAIADLLKIMIPALIVMGTAYFLIARQQEQFKQFLDTKTANKLAELKAESNKTTLPLRLQAYERVILYLERISPNNMIMRVYKPGMSSKLLQAELTRTIREEYEHNMTQQVYVSHNCWLLLKNAKEETIRMINVAAAGIPGDASGLELSAAVFEIGQKIDKMPTDIAINFAKNEVQKLFS